MASIWNGFTFQMKIFSIILILYAIVCFILNYLIKSNRIKPSKLTRIIYEDDEQFIKRWSKEREKSKFIYFITTISKFYLIYAILMLVLLGFDLSLITDKWHIFLGTLMGYTIGSLFSREVREDKYIRLIENINMDDDLDFSRYHIKIEKTDNYKALLVSNLNSMESEIIISILESYNIPCYKKTKGIGGVMEIYSGSNYYGIDIYVQPEMLQIAKELINPDNIEDEIM